MLEIADKSFEELFPPELIKNFSVEEVKLSIAIDYFKEHDPLAVENSENLSPEEQFRLVQRYGRISACGKFVYMFQHGGRFYCVHWRCHDYRGCPICNKIHAEKLTEKMSERMEEAKTEELYRFELDTNDVKYDTVRKSIQREGGDIVQRIPQQDGKVIVYSTLAPRNVSECNVTKINDIPLEQLQDEIKDTPKKTRISGKRKGNNEGEKSNSAASENETVITNIPAITVDNANNQIIAEAALHAETTVRLSDEEINNLTSEDYRKYIQSRAYAFCDYINTHNGKAAIPFYNAQKSTLSTLRKQVREAHKSTEQEIKSEILVTLNQS